MKPIELSTLLRENTWSNNMHIISKPQNDNKSIIKVRINEGM